MVLANNYKVSVLPIWFQSLDKKVSTGKTLEKSCQEIPTRLKKAISRGDWYRHQNFKNRRGLVETLPRRSLTNCISWQLKFVLKPELESVLSKGGTNNGLEVQASKTGPYFRLPLNEPYDRDSTNQISKKDHGFIRFSTNEDEGLNRLKLLWGQHSKL